MIGSTNKYNSDDLENGFRLNQNVEVLPLEGRVVRAGQSVQVQRLEMKVLLVLARLRGQVVKKDALMDEVWGGRAVAPEALTQKIHALRQSFGDSSKDPAFIETVPKIGYRLIAEIVPAEGTTSPHSADQPVFFSSSDAPEAPPQTGVMGVLSDLRQRKVFRVAYIYGVVGWLITQVAETLGDALNLPDIAVTFTVFMVLIGFPVALLLAYALEVRPDGAIEKTPPATVKGQSVYRIIERTVVAGSCLALLVFVSWWVFVRATPPSEPLANVPRPDSIAVLPFENLGSEKEDDFFGEGLSEDIRLQLARQTTLIITPRVGTQDALLAGDQTKQLGQRLGISKILTGTVRKSGNDVRVTVSLIEIENGTQLWIDSYDAKINDPLGLQVQLSQTIAATLASQLEVERPTYDAASDPRAGPGYEPYQHYLRGLDFLGRSRSKESLQLATVEFEKAIDAYPDFAEAHAGLCEVALAQYTRTSRNEFIPQASKHCGRALDLDAGLEETQLALGNLRLEEGDFELARDAFAAAIKLDNSISEAHGGLGKAFARLQEPKKAEASFIRALELRPHWGAHNDFGAFLMQQGRSDEAIYYFRKVTELYKDNPHGYSNLGAAFLYAGDVKSAAAAYQSSIDIEPGRAAYSNLGTMNYYLNEFADAALNYQKALDYAPNDYRLWGNYGDALRFVDSANQPYGADYSYHRAVELADQALEVNRQDDDAWANRAWYLANLGEANSSSESLARALALNPKNMETLYVQALIHAIQHDTDNSVLALLEAVRAGFPLLVIEGAPDLEEARRDERYVELIATIE